MSDELHQINRQVDFRFDSVMALFQSESGDFLLLFA